MPLSEFGKKSSGLGGTTPECRKCRQNRRRGGRPSKLDERRSKATETHKLCTVCGIWKPMGDYYRRNNNPTGRAAACKDCEDRKNNLRLANLSHEQYEAMAQRDLIAARKRRQAKQKRMQDGAAYILAELKRYGVTQKEIMARTGFMSRTLKRIESREAKYIYTSTYERLRGLLDEIIAEYA